VLAGDRALPAARIRPVGDIAWFVDEAARPQPDPQTMIPQA
jgi:hypothetical protein